MGRKGSRLIPFLEAALSDKKYPNLKYENYPSRAFSLNLPQKSSRLEEKCQYILKDWYRLTGRDYKFNLDYTQGKQGMEAALRKSDFLLLIQSGRKKKLIYRILNDEEVREKKSTKKALKKQRKRELLERVNCVPSPQSSGYGSGSDVAEEGIDITSHALLHALKHDHSYEFTIDDYPLEMGSYENHLPPEQNEDLFNADLLGFDLFNTIIPESEINSNFGDANFNISNQDKCPFNEISDVENNLKVQDLLNWEIDFEKLFIDDLLHLSNSSEYEELCRLNNELPPDLDECAAKNDISKQRGLDVITYKTRMSKVYECKYRQDLPGMIILTCEPKVKEFCVSTEKLNEPSSSKLIFDEGTMNIISSCYFEGIKFLPNDHILVFLKCKELVN